MAEHLSGATRLMISAASILATRLQSIYWLCTRIKGHRLNSAARVIGVNLKGRMKQTRVITWSDRQNRKEEGLDQFNACIQHRSFSSLKRTICIVGKPNKT